ncbi:MAG: hypothetical protein CM1200mP2_16700 [Planctomycetaceae bacterium]|nr:MAG: hypothetical protein CM1200mP2_16700 [Planctomycetaceae bacterium]
MPATRNQFSVSHGWMWSRQMTDAGRGGLGGPRWMLGLERPSLEGLVEVRSQVSGLLGWG